MSRDSIKNVSSVLDAIHQDRVRRLGHLAEFTEGIRVFEHAVAVFGSELDAALWLTAEQYALSGHVPADVAITAEGRLRVQILMTQIEYGIYV